MRIMHVSTAHGWRGGEQQLFYLAEGLSNKGIENIIIAQPDSPLQEKARKAAIKSDVLASKGEFDIFAYFALAKLIRKYKPDIVHAHDGHSVTYVAAGSFFSGIKVKRVATRRVDFKLNNSWKYNIGVDKLICISEAIKNICLAGGVKNTKLAKVYSGIDPDRFYEKMQLKDLRDELNIDRKNKVILNVASLTDHKGQCYLLDAMLDVAREIPEVRLLIVGTGELEESLKKQAQELAIDDKVMFLGFRNDVGSLLQLCDLFVMSSHLEGLCTSALDAMANERALVITDAGGLPEVLGDCDAGIIVPAKDPQKLGSAIIELLKDYSRREKMGIRGRQRVNDVFSVDKMIAGNLKIYEELLR